MKIAFLHYHFKPGGVTTVIRQQMAALAGVASTMLVTGPPLEGEVPHPCHRHLPGLGYTDRSGFPPDPVTTAAEIRDAVRSLWPDGCDLFWIHNPLLAKNIALPAIVKQLQRSCPDILLQVHDFAEDGRPDVYHTAPYPRDCHYCVINSRDYGLLLQAGMSREGVHLLPNAVTPVPLPVSPQPDRSGPPYRLYPVRAIRRKNIGEAILLSRFFGNPQRLVITLPPNSEKDRSIYRRWRHFTMTQKIDVHYEAGLRHDFPALVASADSILTTSINEGFGFSFLEPWTAGRWLWGRRLPDICRDFEGAGIRLEHLYDRLEIPLDWIGRRHLENKLAEALQAAWTRFGARGGCPYTRSILEASTNEGLVDFGLLDEGWQRQLIDRLSGSGRDRDRIIALNPIPAAGPQQKADPRVMEENRRRVLKHFGQASYGQRLRDLLSSVVGRPVRQAIDRERLLSLFITSQPFSLLKWGQNEDHP